MEIWHGKLVEAVLMAPDHMCWQPHPPRATTREDVDSSDGEGPDVVDGLEPRMIWDFEVRRGDAREKIQKPVDVTRERAAFGPDLWEARRSI